VQKKVERNFQFSSIESVIKIHNSKIVVCLWICGWLLL
jgi:hypothetical protein